MAAATITVIAIGAAVGAAVGAVGTYAAGGRGDALWKGALTGAVAGAVTGGVGSWAGGALGATAGGALAGASGGVAAGALGTALNGGNGSDYLRNIATGGLSGAALGAAGGYLGGGEAAAGAEGATAGEAGSGLAQGGTGLETGGAMGEGAVVPGTSSGSGATAVEGTVTGPTTAPTTTTPALADTVSSLDTGGAMAGGGSTVAPSLSTPTPSSTTPDLSTSAFGTGGTTTSKTTDFTGVDFTKGEVPVDGVNFAENTPTQQNAYWEKYLPGGAPENPTELGNTWGKITQKMDGYPSPNTTGKGMGLEDYLKLQGKAQLIGGGVKTLGALATAPETQQNKQQLMDLYNQQNDANQYYQNLQQQSYQNPMGYLGSGEAQATRSAALQKLIAQNAAAGRRTSGSALQNQLMMNQLQNLQAYRRGIPQPQYGTAAQTLNYAQQYSPTADIMGGLASGVTPLSLYSLFPG